MKHKLHAEDLQQTTKFHTQESSRSPHFTTATIRATGATQMGDRDWATCTGEEMSAGETRGVILKGAWEEDWTGESEGVCGGERSCGRGQWRDSLDMGMKKD